MRFACLLAAALSSAAIAAETNDDHVKLSLISEQTALVPGTTTWLALRLDHEPHWHTYWINPGDSGLPTKLAWQLPAGYEAAEPQWPTPQRITVSDLANFGYTGDVAVPVQITVPRDAADGSTAHIGADVKYLVCREECVPGKATVAINLPVHAIAAADPRSAHAFDVARGTLPTAATFGGEAHVDGGNVDVVLRNPGIAADAKVDAFALDRKVVANAAPSVARQGRDVVLTFKKSDYFDGSIQRLTLLVQAGAHAWRVAVPLDGKPASR